MKSSSNFCICTIYKSSFIGSSHCEMDQFTLHLPFTEWRSPKNVNCSKQRSAKTFKDLFTSLEIIQFTTFVRKSLCQTYTAHMLYEFLSYCSYCYEILHKDLMEQVASFWKSVGVPVTLRFDSMEVFTKSKFLWFVVFCLIFQTVLHYSLLWCSLTNGWD